MTKKRWIAVAIVAAVVVGSLGLIKLFPFWVTLACLVSVVAGFAAGYLFKKDIIKEIEKVTTKKVTEKVPVPTSKGEGTHGNDSSTKASMKKIKIKSAK